MKITLPQDIPAGYYLESVSVIPKEINVRGTERDLAKINSVGVAPTLAELESGKELFLPLNTEKSEAFDDEEAISINPQMVRINASLVRGLPRKKVSVNVRLNGKPSADYAIQSVTTDPHEVMIEGAKDKLDGVTVVETETVDISGMMLDQTIVVPLVQLKDKNVSIVDAKDVKLSIKLEPIAAQRQLSNIPITIEGAAAGVYWMASPAVADVTIEAPPSIMESLNIEKLGLKVYVDVSNMFLDTTALPVRADIADAAFKVVKVDPSIVNVSVVAESMVGR